jgi:hypothetical protein
MRHVKLTCRNHPELRWTCKSIAYSPGHGYNGSRNIFFHGYRESMPANTPLVECNCGGKDLTLAPEDEWYLLSIEEQKQAINAD